jgi:exopolysaccharide biosynthesis polyprenyl glycosylphosphotransferase
VARPSREAGRTGSEILPSARDIEASEQEAVATNAQPAAARPSSLPADWLPIALLVGDGVIAAASVPFGYWLRYIDARQSLPFGPYVAAIPIVVLLYFLALTINHQYSSWRGRTLVDQLLSLYYGVAFAAVLLLAAIEVANLGQSYSRLTLLPAVLFAAVLMTGERYALRQFETNLRRRGIGTESVLMVGTGEGSEMLIRRMNMFPQYGFHVAGVATDDVQRDRTFVGVPVVGQVDDLPRLVKELHVDQVFLALPGSQRERLLHLVKLCEDENIEFKIVPDLLEVMTTRVASDSIDGLPLVGIRRSRMRGPAATVKRLVDIAVSAVLLVVLSPLMLVVALLIKAAMPGPALFTQERIGYQRRPFVIYKFRSMVPDAEAQTGPVVARPGDSRTTALGRFLRRTSIDELPQLLNVLRGDMSIVGPRPQPTFFDERYSGEIPRYLERRQVRPGLTGWAEVNDLRGAAPIADRTLYDVYYIENWSLTLDLKIIALTALRFLTQRHAY